jgi:hypothetical protein
MDSTEITTVDQLKFYLHTAMKLEHATIPPYLLALYSIHPGANPDAAHILRVVVVEEMLHLTLAANLLNAVGGEPNLTVEDFVPTYPTKLPDGETDFEVDLQGFSKAAIETFLLIERPAEAPTQEARIVRRASTAKSFVSATLEDPHLHYYSIGEFYAAIGRGFDYLSKQLTHEQLFSGKLDKQATSEYYYSGGGELFAVTDVDTAKAAVELISGQGEGLGGGIYDKEGELAHYYRFLQLLNGQYYQPGDTATKPSGPALSVNWKAAYPVLKNPSVSHYGDGELHAAAVAFNQAYADFLALLTTAFNGQPQLLLEAVPQMFRLREKITQLIHNPVPDMPGVHAAPTFEVGTLQGVYK